MALPLAGLEWIDPVQQLTARSRPPYSPMTAAQILGIRRDSQVDGTLLVRVASLVALLDPPAPTPAEWRRVARWQIREVPRFFARRAIAVSLTVLSRIFGDFQEIPE